MLINRSVLDLVHLVELSLEEDELLARVRFGVDHSLLVLLEGVDNLEEVALAHKELEVLGVSALCIIHTVCVISMKIMASVNHLPLMVSIGSMRPSWSKYCFRELLWYSCSLGSYRG